MFPPRFAATQLKVPLRLIFKANDKMLLLKWSCQSAENYVVGKIITRFCRGGGTGLVLK